MTIKVIDIKKELEVFLRNQDILTTSQRGVTTATHTETLSNASSSTISSVSVKNIRSITVDGTSLSLGEDYTVDYGEGDENCVISFVSNQTGDLVVSYDHGSDKIYSDYPRDDLSISSYPRIAVDLLNSPGDAFGIGGNHFITDHNITVVVYANNANDIDNYIDSIREAFLNNAKNFYYIKFIKPTLVGPMISDPEKKEEIMQRNIDFVSQFNVETIS